MVFVIEQFSDNKKTALCKHAFVRSTYNNYVFTGRKYDVAALGKRWFYGKFRNMGINLALIKRN